MFTVLLFKFQSKQMSEFHQPFKYDPVLRNIYG